MRPPREDYTGAWWHVTNRGAAKRVVFETSLDVERFLACLGEVVTSGLIEVHAYSILTTHYHVLVRSTSGQISEAMRLAVNHFVRGFNRTRGRDGALFRGRFCGRRIDDPLHWENALRYIDLNPVRAGLCDVPSDHPHGSARSYRYDGGPDWLTRGAVERVVRGAMQTVVYDPSTYDGFAAACDPVANAYLTERLLSHPSSASPAFADLVRSASSRQQGWMVWKSALADGTVPGTAFLSPEQALRAASVASRVLCRGQTSKRRLRAARDLSMGLLYFASGQTVAEVARASGIAPATAHAGLRRHSSRLSESRAYAELVARVLRTAVLRSVRPPRNRVGLGGRVRAGPDVVTTVDWAYGV